MTIANQLLAEYEQEAHTTRKFVERLPGDKLDWKPSPQSMTAGQLALHIAASPAQVLEMSLADRVVIPDFSRGNPQPASVQEVLTALEKCGASLKSILPTLSDERMQATLPFMQGDREMFSMPRAAFLRSIMLNHLYHHRGQFGVYLRLLGAKVPSSYGPSGDELPDFMA